MSPDKRYTVGLARWPADRDALREVRYQVFVEEQSIAADLEWDGQDATASHVLARAADGTAIGTGRLLPDGHIGRMAVLSDWRRVGVGAEILSAVLSVARQRGLPAVWLAAQRDAIGFYSRAGFSSEGEEYLEAGIPHLTMRRRLSVD